MSDKKSIVLLEANQLSRLIRNKEISCREVMEIYLDHIESFNPRVNAIISMRDKNSLLKEADEKDIALEKGEYQGWLHGIPFAVKDLALTQGITTTRGSPIFADNVPDKDALIVERIKKAGAIIIGKTNTPEFGLGSQTYNSVFGATGNAYNHQLTAGGSSGGAAAALAMYLLPVADGSDMMGSLRNPAAFNNVIGFRPSQGRVPLTESDELFINQMAYEGPMGRCVKDVALLLATQAGRDDRAPLSLNETGDQFTESLVMDCTDVRVGWLGDLQGHLPFEEGILSLCEKARNTFSAIGCEVNTVAIDIDFETVWNAWRTLRHISVAHSLEPLYSDPGKRKWLKPEALWEIENGLGLSAMQLMQASAVRTLLYKKIIALFEEVDYLILPSAQVFPFDKNSHWPETISGREMDTYHRWMEVTILGSLTGCPIANVPAGFNESGLPTGIQIIGRPQRDMAVLRLAHAYEKATQWIAKNKPDAIKESELIRYLL
ncbi:amidase [Citrobacter sp. MNAZ 1397]|uniref:amidase n=1 Tax=Citrobacter sp. MNAZ 1397 TaxID=2911205 RepID=UPI002025CE31|nr:amidase [Citrobacter sp. MNAZ 1397]MCL9673969.1 amidase [Citrobacter sp. MNAZ 1397]